MVRELAPQDSSGGYTRPQYSFDGVLGSPEFPSAICLPAHPTPRARRPAFAPAFAPGCRGPLPPVRRQRLPWCHRVLLALALRGLSGAVSVTRLLDIPERATRGGWVMPAEGDPVWGAADLWEVYDKGSPGFKGRCTAPLLVDKAGRRLVCNESASLVPQLAALELPGANAVELRPAALAAAIDDLNDWIYPSINNGVYRCGFATSQAAYDRAAAELHGALARADAILADSRFLAGDRFTEADLRLFPTVVRFDAVYAAIFRAGQRRVADYPHLEAWMRDVHQIRVADTVDVDECRRSYYTNLFPLNPSGIIPSGPTAADLRLDAPHGRGGGSLEEVFHLRQAAAVAGGGA
ncbi:MAG: putative glutathione S-transferase [Monoraphidium minutum]|nr:MAG: putative glutathione S-transferase [Monoraphidium minutum]